MELPVGCQRRCHRPVFHPIPHETGCEERFTPRIHLYKWENRAAASHGFYPATPASGNPRFPLGNGLPFGGEKCSGCKAKHVDFISIFVSNYRQKISC